MSHLPVPRSVLNSHVAILGKTGAAKSSVARVCVEDLHIQKKRFFVIDPKGDWFGLKVGADGKSPGVPVILFGDFKEGGKTDVPINAHSGKHVAELITAGNRPCVIGFRGWTHADMVQFWIDFASTLFNSNKGELYGIIDECHNFMPKGKIMDPQAGKCLHWSNRIMSEGRGLGLIFIIVSQRPQKVHNDSLTCCETLFAMRVTHAADREATKDWIDGCGDKDQGKLVLDSLASLNKAEPYVWSPENNFGPKRVQFPMFRTFDSFAPPQLQKRILSSSWADVDLDEVKGKLASVIEESKANDPRELKKTIAELQSKIRKFETAPPAAAKPLPAPEPIRIYVVEDDALSAIERDIEAMNEVAAELREMSGKIEKELPNIRALHERLKTLTAAPMAPRTTAAPTRQLPPPHLQSPLRPPRLDPTSRPGYAQPLADNGEWKPSKCARSILSVLVQFRKPLSKSRLALLSGYSVNSSTFDNGMSECRTNGAIAGTGDSITATAKADDVVPVPEELPRGDALLNYWVNKVGAQSAPGKILRYLIQRYPEQVTKEDIGTMTGYSPSSSTFDNALSTLRTLELITRDREPAAHPDLFE